MKQFNVRLSDNQIEALAKIQNFLQAETQAEALRRSLALAESLSDRAEEGYSIILKKGEEEKEIIMA